MSDDGFSDRLREQVLAAYGFDSMEELDPDGSYRAARAELDAREAAYRASLPERMEKARQAAIAELEARGVLLPPGVELCWGKS